MIFVVVIRMQIIRFIKEPTFGQGGADCLLICLKTAHSFCLLLSRFPFSAMLSPGGAPIPPLLVEVTLSIVYYTSIC